MAWIAIDGQPLLASLNSRPAPGSVLTFKILSLSPQIHLQELSAAEAMPSTLTGVISFTEARRRFETALEPHRPALMERDFHERILHFATLLNSPALQNAHAEVQASADSVNSTNRAYRLSYSPLLLPSARDQATFTRAAKGFVELIHEFTLPRLRDVQVHLMHKSGQTSYKVKLRKTTHLETLRKIISRSDVLSRHAEYLGAERMTGPPGGMLAGFLASKS